MMNHRRARPTIRSLTEDLELRLPPLDVDLGMVDHPWLAELRRIAPTAPKGQKRILSIKNPLLYNLRLSAQRGATWLEHEAGIVWLCAVQRRNEDSGDDAYVRFRDLYRRDQLMPSKDDRLRDSAEAAIRRFHACAVALQELADEAISQKGTELREDLDGYLPCRMLAIQAGGLDQIWCALSERAADGGHVSDSLRELLFAKLAERFPSALFEVRHDWPTGTVEWFEVVWLGLR